MQHSKSLIPADSIMASWKQSEEQYHCTDEHQNMIQKWQHLHEPYNYKGITNRAVWRDNKWLLLVCKWLVNESIKSNKKSLKLQWQNIKNKKKNGAVWKYFFLKGGGGEEFSILWNALLVVLISLNMAQTRKSLQKNKVALRTKHRDELMKKKTDKIEYTATIF